MIRPRFRMPLWAALAIPGAAYAVRSVILRDGNFAPDVPADLIALGAYGIAVFAVAWARRGYSEQPSDVDELRQEPPANDA